MNGDATIGIVGALFGLLVGCVGVPALFIFVFVKLRGAQQDLDSTAAAVRAGTVTELLPWTSASLSELTREWVGESTFTSGVPGRGDRAGGRVPSGRSPSGWLLAFTMEAKNDGAEGLVLAVTTAHRLELRVTGGVCFATVNGAPLGSSRLGEPGLFSPDGSPLGNYRREPPVAQLALRGRDVAKLDTRTTSDAKRTAAPGFVVTHLLADRTAEDEAWVLVAAVLELAWFGPRLEHRQLQGRARVM